MGARRTYFEVLELVGNIGQGEPALNDLVEAGDRFLGLARRYLLVRKDPALDEARDDHHRGED